MNPKIRFIGRYGDYRIGEVIAPPASLRKLLLDRKLVEFVTAEKEKQQKAAKKKWR